MVSAESWYLFYITLSLRSLFFSRYGKSMLSHASHNDHWSHVLEQSVSRVDVVGESLGVCVQASVCSGRRRFRSAAIVGL